MTDVAMTFDLCGLVGVETRTGHIGSVSMEGPVSDYVLGLQQVSMSAWIVC